MKAAYFILWGVLLSFSSGATTITWTNSNGGNWNDPSNWAPNQVPTNGDTANVTANGLYIATINTDVTVAELNLGAASGTQTILLDSSILNVTSAGSILGNGELTVSGSSGLRGTLTVKSGGVLEFGGSGGLSKTIYGLVLVNQGTVNHLDGGVYGDGSTTITNQGLWDIQGNMSLLGSGTGTRFENTASGIIRKSAGSGTAQIGSIVLNQQGSVEVEVGTLNWSSSGVWTLGGTTTVAANALFQVVGGSATDAGGVFTGAGSSRFNGGTLTLNQDVLSGLELTGGTVELGPVFQGDGKIHSLTLEGSILDDDVEVAGGGVLNANDSSGLRGTLTVESGGELDFGGSGGLSKTIYGLVLVNQGTVNHLDGGVYGDASTTITNQGLWDIQGNMSLLGSGTGTRFENTASGIIRKSAGSGTAQIGSLALVNEGLIESVLGTLRMPNNYENTGGILRLSGGRLESGGTLLFSGGTLEGSGSFGLSRFVGGTISPGLGGPGKITFTSGLNLSSNVTLSIDANGPVAGTNYDQLSVISGVFITNSTLVFTPTTSLPLGTELRVVENDGTDSIQGMFNGFADGTLFTANFELYRTWYMEGTGNDFTIIRSPGGARLTPAGFDMSGGFVLNGLGTNDAIYTIFATPVIPTNVWEELGDVTADPGGKFQFIDTNAHLFNTRFYRSLGPL